MEKNETLELVRQCLYDDSLSSDIKKIILNLYSKYIKLEKIKNNYKNNITLNDLENKIYFVNNKKLTEIEKIKLEINYYNNKTKNKEIYSRLQNLIKLIDETVNNKEISDQNLLKVKQKIVEIQILSNEKITFYEAAYKLFEDYCFSIKENKIK